MNNGWFGRLTTWRIPSCSVEHVQRCNSKLNLPIHPSLSSKTRNSYPENTHPLLWKLQRNNQHGQWYRIPVAREHHHLLHRWYILWYISTSFLNMNRIWVDFYLAGTYVVAAIVAFCMLLWVSLDQCIYSHSAHSLPFLQSAGVTPLLSTFCSVRFELDYVHWPDGESRRHHRFRAQNLTITGRNPLWPHCCVGALGNCNSYLPSNQCKLASSCIHHRHSHFSCSISWVTVSLFGERGSSMKTVSIFVFS